MAFDFHPFLCESDERAMIDERLDGLEADAIYEICADRTEPQNTRFFGALRLPPKRQTQLIDCLVLDSSDVLWTALHKWIPLSDSLKLRGVLRQYFDESTDEFRSAAIHILAKFGDECVLSNAEGLLASSDSLDRVLAVASLRMLGSDAAWETLRRYWPQVNQPLDTRVRAAGDLLQYGEVEPLPFLIETAQQDQTETAYYSLMSIYHHHDKVVGLQFMYDILNTTMHGAQGVTLQHVAGMMGDLSIRDQHDGLNVAREWLATQLGTR